MSVSSIVYAHAQTSQLVLRPQMAQTCSQKTTRVKIFLICPSDSNVIETNQCNLIIKDNFYYGRQKRSSETCCSVFFSPEVLPDRRMMLKLLIDN